MRAINIEILQDQAKNVFGRGIALIADVQRLSLSGLVIVDRASHIPSSTVFVSEAAQ